MVHTTYPKLVRWLGTLALAASLCQAQPLAFPGAEGFGRFTSGGRGGSVFEVTNLNDHGPGSLRAAIKARGPRTVVFRVSGTIVLQSELRIENGDLTIAGQTAPGSGICIRDYPINIFADNIIIRYIRVRLGDVHKLAEDAASAFFQKDIIIDHCSFSWGTDEVLTIRDNENSTVQWCLISESLSHSYHPKGDHGYGGIWGGMGASFHHNLLAHHTSRTPRFNGSRYHKQPEKELVDYRNNVIYNWGFNSAYGGEAGQQNVLANYYKYGPGTKPKDRIIEPWDSKGKWFVNDNFVYGFPEITADNWAGGVQGKFRHSVRVDAPHPSAPVTTQTAEEAYKLVLANVGAVLPKRDSVDSRIIQEVKSGTATYGGIRGAGSGIIDSQTQVGGWPVLRSAPAPPDSDHDGMPDEWEIENGLNPADPVDRNRDRNGDGYTNLENYLNELASGIEH
jgi:pectate lyase